MNSRESKQKLNWKTGEQKKLSNPTKPAIALPKYHKEIIFPS
jgi:hypothetical protein